MHSRPAGAPALLALSATLQRGTAWWEGCWRMTALASACWAPSSSATLSRPRPPPSSCGPWTRLSPVCAARPTPGSPSLGGSTRPRARCARCGPAPGPHCSPTRLSPRAWARPPPTAAR
ncbi:hypothetical protein F751_3483 [Auxenochlorella protothecoides]|uniref:Secreted protein n=1 Tax=Auxenochlorella protothecoides TaxID=3075 RepID=A0A087SC38_AUXPR|nr:hypothetical protein F751_3483 [Auxenochlorella protothecoides]KFM23292.1 hypothetical protein F751_3483 [Auxenochlorella protothecoides]